MPSAILYEDSLCSSTKAAGEKRITAQHTGPGYWEQLPTRLLLSPPCLFSREDLGVHSCFQPYFCILHQTNVGYALSTSQLLPSLVPPWSASGRATLIKIIIFYASLLKSPSTLASPLPTLSTEFRQKKRKPRTTKGATNRSDTINCYHTLWELTPLPIFPVGSTVM